MRTPILAVEFARALDDVVPTYDVASRHTICDSDHFVGDPSLRWSMCRCRSFQAPGLHCRFDNEGGLAIGRGAARLALHRKGLE